MNLSSFSLLLFSFGVLLIGILTLAKRRDYIAILFLNFSLAVCGWGFPYAFWLSKEYSEQITFVLIKLGHLYANFIPITWAHFAFTFIQKKEPIRCFYLANYIFAALLTLSVPTPLFIKGVRAIADFRYFTLPGPLFNLFTGIFFSIVPYTFFYLVKSFRKATDQTREQLKYLIIGTIIGFLSGSTLFLPTYGIPFPLWFLVAMPIYPVLMGIALIRHGLFNSNQIASAFQREKLTAIGIMTTSINHELRNPLFIAKGRIESHLDAVHSGLYESIAEKEHANEKVFSTALLQLNRAIDVIQRLSSFSKPFIASEKREFVDVKGVINDVLKFVSNELELKKIKYVEGSFSQAKVFINRRSLEEIFFNLILNACQAMSNGGGELHIQARQKNGAVEIEIRDTGLGISREDQVRIFEPFYSTKHEEGTGLGLYIAKQLVEKNSGKIAVTSNLKKGTSFKIEFINQYVAQTKCQDNVLQKGAAIT